MDIFLSKFLPVFIYPLGLVSILLIAVLLIRRKPKLSRILALSALLVLILASNHWAAHGLARSLEWQYQPMAEIPAADAIVILGGGTQPAEPPRPIIEVNGAGDRVIYGALLYHQGVSENLLVSGGRISWLSPGGEENTSPAEEMATLLEILNVPEDAIWLEPDSRNTLENALFSHDILQEKGVNRIILVTSAMHMPRSVKLFQEQGFDVIPAPVDYRTTRSDWEGFWDLNFQKHLFRLLPGADNLSLTTRAIKEHLGILFYTLRGWD